MKPIDFIVALRENVIGTLTKYYEQELNNFTPEYPPGWQLIAQWYNSLEPEQKAHFIEFIRTIQVDTISLVLGILVGKDYLNEERVEFTLMAGEEVITGDLQDIFLEIEEDFLKKKLGL